MKSEHAKLLTDKLWRLNNLYWIKDKKGKRVRFRMTAEQLDFFQNMHTRNLILKARQLGFTTEVCIMQLDDAMFEGMSCAMIAHTRPDAQRLFRTKTRYAYNNLPDSVRKANPLEINNTDEFVFAKGGSVSISTSFRGGTIQRLHVSEFGKICAKHPEKAREIVTGAIEAVPIDGIATLESTAEGRHGFFFDFCMEAEKLKKLGVELTSQDYKLFFYSWWQNPEYQQRAQPIPSRLQRYFRTLELRHGIKLTAEQQSWYYSKEKSLGADMKREYPSTSAEPFEQSIEGAYYATQFAKLYEKGRIAEELPDNPTATVNTYWDLGISDSTSIWFIKKIAGEYHVIDYYSNSGEGLAHYFKVLKEKGYDYGEHFAPHDIDHRRFGEQAKSLKQIALDGVEIDESGDKYSLEFITVNRTLVNTGIEQVRNILPKCVFHQSSCDEGLKGLESYRKEWDSLRGIYKNNPLHDWASHPADAFRYFAVSEMEDGYATEVRVDMYT